MGPDPNLGRVGVPSESEVAVDISAACFLLRSLSLSSSSLSLSPAAVCVPFFVSLCSPHLLFVPPAMSLLALSALLAAAASVATAQITDPTQTFPATPLASKHFSYPTGVVSVLALFTSVDLPRCPPLVRG